MDKQQAKADGDKMVTVQNNTLHMRLISIPTGETVKDEAGKDIPITKVLRIPSGRRDMESLDVTPGIVEITAAEWAAIKAHPSARYMLRSERGRRPVLQLAD